MQFYLDQDPTNPVQCFSLNLGGFKKMMIFYKMIPSEINLLEFSNSYDPKYESWRWFPIKGDAKNVATTSSKLKPIGSSGSW